MASVKDLEQIKEQLKAMNTDVSEELVSLVAVELNRRKNSGRKPSPIDRRERNRLAQQRFRAKKKVVDK